MKKSATALRPLHDRLIVRRLEVEERFGKLYIPENAQEKPQRGEVLAAGEGKVLENGTRLEMSVHPGDRILFGKYSGGEVQIDGEELVIMREEEVFGILED